MSKSDLLSRIRGGEFVIILQNYSNIEQIKWLAETLLKTISAPFTVEIYDINLSASIGVSICSDNDNNDEDKLLSFSVHALSKAKTSGRSRYVILDPQRDLPSIDQSQLIPDLRAAINNGE